MHVYEGIIRKGKGYGKILGFPTANIELPQEVEGGIYAAEATIDGHRYIAAVFIDPAERLLEANLLDFSGEIYGKTLRVELMKKIRESKKFEDENALKRSIASDIEDVRSFFRGL